MLDTILMYVHKLCNIENKISYCRLTFAIIYKILDNYLTSFQIFSIYLKKKKNLLDRCLQDQ